MSDEVKAAFEEGLKHIETQVKNTISAYQETVDTRLAEIKKSGEVSGDTTEKLAKMDAFADGMETIKQETQRQAAAIEEIKNLTERFENFMGRLPAGARPQDDERGYKKSVNGWVGAAYRMIKIGRNNMSPDQIKFVDDAVEEAKTLQITPEESGGYLAPLEYVRRILKDVTEKSEMRGIVTVRSTTQRGIEIPKRIGRTSAVWVAEQDTRPDTGNMRYGMLEIPTHELVARISITNWMLEDSVFDMEAEIREEASDQFAIAEGDAVLTGDGTGKPSGLLTASGVQEDVTGSAASIADADGQANGFITLYGNLKTEYTRNARWLMNRRTIASIRKLKLEDGNYLWQPGLAVNTPNMILSCPYTEVPGMPDIAAGTYPVLFGDFKRAYILVDRIAMELLRDNISESLQGQVRYLFRKRLGGAVAMQEAYRKLKVAAS